LCTEILVPDDVLSQIVKQTSACDAQFLEAVPKDAKKEIRALRAASVRLSEGQSLSAEQSDLLFSKLGISPGQLAEAEARDQIFHGYRKNVCGDIKIKITTILKSKGLSYDYVFLMNFDDRYLIPKDGLTDESLHKFLVALTRSRKKITIFSSQAGGPTFVQWIGHERKRVTSIKH
jgi:superfamily I DNA/RNA helicase